MDDTRGEEHVKLSTDFGGKSQLNLGHLVDAQKRKRGEGFELRTDHWGAIRAGKGVFISADAQPKAQGPVQEMDTAVGRLKQAGEQIHGLSEDAKAAGGDPAEVHEQMKLLREEIEQLRGAVALLSAPQGIALTSGTHLQLAAARNLMFNAGGQADISVVKRLFMGVGQGLSVFVRKLGIKLLANQGAVSIQAQNDKLELMARHGLDITSTEDEIHITAKKKITLNGGGSYITLDPHRIESGTAGDYLVKSAYFDYSGPASLTAAHPEYPAGLSKQRLSIKVPQAPNAAGRACAGMPFKLYADGLLLREGVLDKTGVVPIDHQVITRSYRLVFANGSDYQIPIPIDYRNVDQAQLANSGVHNHPSNETSHTDHRLLYADTLNVSLPDAGNPQ
jgi:type VI secretion system secreted protein VgrG